MERESSHQGRRPWISGLDRRQTERYPAAMGMHRFGLSLGFFVGSLLGLSGCGDNTQGLECGTGTTEVGGECVASGDVCGPGTQFVESSGQCEQVLDCAPGTILEGATCVPDGSVICESGTQYNASTGRCEPDITGCGPGTVLDDQLCIPTDDAISASTTEADEPNDSEGLAGDVALPSLTTARSIYGCIQPVDTDGNGSVDIDRDSYRFTAIGPTLLDISVDGIDGLSGAFVVRAASGALADDDWSRTGLNLVSDTSRRQVFLPSAGDYFLEILDGRSVLVPEPVGGSDTCYFASIRNLVLPAAETVTAGELVTGSLGSNARFLSFAPDAEGDIVEDVLAMPSSVPAASLAYVHMRAGRYAGGRQGGNALSNTTGGLRSTSNLLIVVEPEFNYALDAVDYEYSLTRFGSPEIASGIATTIAVGTGAGEQMAWTEVGAGDVVRIRANDGNLTLQSLDAELEPRTELCSGCPNSEFFYQAQESGLLYLGLEHASATTTFEATLDVQRVQPTDLALDQPLTNVALGEAGVDFFATLEAAFGWSILEASPTNFGGALEARRYPRDREGFLDLELGPVETIELATGSPRPHLASEEQSSLWRLADSAFDGLADTEVYDVSIATRDFTDLAPESGTDATASAVAVDAGQEGQRYLLQASAGQVVDVTVSTSDSIDLSIAQLSDFEVALVVTNEGGDTATETVRITMPEGGYLPLLVESLAGAGSYDLVAHIVDMP